MSFRFRNQVKDRLFAHVAEPGRSRAEKSAQRLLEAYHLQAFHDDSEARNYRENLFYVELLERAFVEARVELPPALSAADIGCSSWFYVQGLHALLKWWRAPAGRDVRLRGYEVDAHRPEVLSRQDYARAHIRSLDVEYRPEPFAAEPHAFEFVSMLFPFLFMRDHQEWGLADLLFAPEHLLADAWRSVKPGGVLAIVNQGDEEHRRESEMLRAAGIFPLAAFRHDSLLFAYELPRYVVVASRGT